MSSFRDMKASRSRAVSRGPVTAVILVVVVIAVATLVYLNPPSSSTASTQSTQLYTFTNFGQITSVSLATASSSAPPANAVYIYIPDDGGYPFAQYTPQVVTVIIGVNNTVVWVNQDRIVHNMIAFNGAFNSGDVSPGASYQFTFTQAGVYSYYCSYHPSMAGTIIVENS